MRSSNDSDDLREHDPKAHARPPRRLRVPHVARALVIVAVIGLAGYRYATLRAVGACTNPYTVEQGDWLYKIAQACGVDPAALLAANALADPNQIRPGQQLVL